MIAISHSSSYCAHSNQISCSPKILIIISRQKSVVKQRRLAETATKEQANEVHFVNVNKPMNMQRNIY